MLFTGALLAGCSSDTAGAAGAAGANQVRSIPAGASGAVGEDHAGATTTAAAGSAVGGSAGAAVSHAACESTVFCDDFETDMVGSPPGAPWSSTLKGGTVVVDGTRVHSGNRSVKLSADSATGYRSVMISLQKTAFLPTPTDVFYGRMMFWLESAPTDEVHWTFIDAQGIVPGQGYHAVYRYGGQKPLANGAQFIGSQLMANYETPDSYNTPPVGPSTDCYAHSDAQVVPVGTWACAEWKFDGSANALRFWLNGSEVASLAVNGTGQGCTSQSPSYLWTAPVFERVDLGWESYQSDAARTIWIDDVAIGADRVGCPK